MLTIQKAAPEELDEIWAMVVRAVAHMNRLGNPQWGEDYPTRQFYADDIARGELYAARVDGQLAGVACINTEQAPEYAAVPWQTPPRAIVVHRMAVEPRLQRCGVGAALFRHAEQLARERGLRAFRLDTYSLNDRMQGLLLRLGFQQAGEIHLHGRPLTYPCFEKTL